MLEFKTSHLNGNQGGDNMRDISRVPQIGEVYLMRFSGSGSEQQGWRPGLVFQNNTGNIHSPNIIALPLTSSLKKVNMPTHVLVLSSNTGLKTDSLILCENPQRMSKDCIGQYITKLSNDYMTQVAEASLLSSSVISYLSVESLVEIWGKAAQLNTVATI